MSRPPTGGSQKKQLSPVRRENALTLVNSAKDRKTARDGVIPVQLIDIAQCTSKLRSKDCGLGQFLQREKAMGLKLVLATVSLMFLSAVSAADPLDPAFDNPETGRLASELFQFCDSSDPDKLAYCEGYISGAAYIWKFQHACSSVRREDQLFCAGAEDARTSLQEAISACADCDQPEGRHKFRDELRAAGDICAADESHDENYCAGYNAWIEFAAANLMPFQPIEAGQNAKDIGFSHATGDIFLHLWASSEIHGFVPCLEWKVRPEQMREVFVKFMRDNPAQQTGSTAVIVVEKALYYGLCPGPELGLKPHMEQCISWDPVGGQFGATNLCDEEVAIEFVSQSREIERLEIPGKSFLASSKLSGMPWMFTVCPMGHGSSVPFQTENSDTIRASHYSCLRR